MKRKLVPTTAVIQSFSRRRVHSALRRAAGVMSAEAAGTGSAAFGFHQDHQAGEGEHGDEEEEVIADDGADAAHFRGARGEDAVFGELMQAADEQLEGDEVEDDGGDAEEALQVDADAAADEEDAEDDGDGDAERGCR